MIEFKDRDTRKTLMIVEDEVLVATMLRDELEGAGYHVLDLTDRHVQALKVAKARKPDLALEGVRYPAVMGDDPLRRCAAFFATAPRRIRPSRLTAIDVRLRALMERC